MFQPVTPQRAGNKKATRGVALGEVFNSVEFDEIKLVACAVVGAFVPPLFQSRILFSGRRQS